MCRCLPLWLPGLALLLILNSCTSSAVTHISEKHPMPAPAPQTVVNSIPGIRSLIDTWRNIHIFQTFDYNITNPNAVAKYYDFVWGAGVDHAAALRSGNPYVFLSYYILFHRDSGTFLDNTVIQDLTYWKTFHPDWILYKCDRTTPAYESGEANLPLDFASPELVAWQIQTYAQPASENGYDGIAADNVDMQNLYGACGVYKDGQWVQRYTGQVDDPQWRADILSWLARMQQALHHLQHPLALIPNLVLGDLSPGDPQVQQVLSHLDGILDEAGFTNCGRGYITDSRWEQEIQFIEAVQKQHKPYYVIDQFPVVGADEIQWALASYLLGKEHTEAVFISTVQNYGNYVRYSEYNAQIGSPDGAMYRLQHVYLRNYSQGLSIVNPSATNSYKVTLTTRVHYRDIEGHLVGQTITMPPHSGLVLLATSDI